MRISDWSSDVCSSDLSTRRAAFVLQDNLLISELTVWETLYFSVCFQRPELSRRERDQFVAEMLELLDLWSIKDNKIGGVDSRGISRSEERRVGKACVSTGRSRWSPDHEKKKKD